MVAPPTTRRTAAYLAWHGARSATRIACSATLMALVIVPGFARADDVAVPISLQAALLARVAAYDGNLASRASDRVRVLIVTRRGDPDSERFGVQAKNALAAVPKIVGLEHDQTIVPYASAAELAKLCQEKNVTILYFMPGLSDQIEAIARALVGISILTATAVGADARRGIIVGFDLVSGKTTLLVNLRQARQQNVSLSADVLRLATVYQ